MTTTPTTYSAHYISGTHWDREWYRPVQEFRLLLVELIDGLLELMERDDAFRYFHLDGQTCVLADYLEVRPEHKERLARLIREGRILIGPWFTMPDLFCPGDEALLRNFLMGQRICRAWGVEPMAVAYTCDMFGHPSQMPQIYRGFGLRHCVLGRGTNESTTPTFFTWAAPDGSQVFTFKLQDSMGYGSFMGSRQALEQAQPDDPDAEERARQSLKSYVTEEIARANGSTLCLIDALDHQTPATDAPRYLRILHEACPTVQAHHSTLPAFFADAEATAVDVPVKHGELREPAIARCGYLWLIPNCVSARVGMKQANDACQTLLERWCEPFLAFANRDGVNFPTRYLEIAWEHVLLNHAHDSICGCSIDQVHRDMQYRFDQAQVLGAQIRNRTLGGLTAGCRELGREPHEFTVLLTNPVPRRRTEVVRFPIDLPQDFPAAFQEGFRSQSIKSFTLSTPDGREVPYQRLEMDAHVGERSQYAVTGWVTDVGGERLRIWVAAEVDLPPMGFTALLVKPCPTPLRRLGSLRTGPAAAETAHLAVAIAPNGTLTLTDKATGEVYTDLLTLEDRSEIGDGWFHGETLSDEIVLSSASPAQVAVLHDGPEIVTFAVTVTLDLPVRYDWHQERRSAERAPLRVTHRISLRRDARQVEVETLVDNTIEDHRLRLLLPTDTGAESYLAHHPYDLVERLIARDPRAERWSEPDLSEKPFLGLQAVGAGTRGLAFLAEGGLHEGGVADDARRTMLVTLLRSFRRTVGTPGERDGLELGLLTYRYALRPFAGEFPRAETLHALAALQAGLHTRQSGRLSSGYPALAGEDAPVQSFCELTQGTLVLSACKPAEDGDALVIRLWNPTGAPATETLRLWRPVRTATRITLAELPDPDAPTPHIDGHTITVEAGPHQIVTVAVVV
jgi:mannosylglycerate hydrolase